MEGMVIVQQQQNLPSFHALLQLQNLVKAESCLRELHRGRGGSDGGTHPNLCPSPCTRHTTPAEVRGATSGLPSFLSAFAVNVNGGCKQLIVCTESSSPFQPPSRAKRPHHARPARAAVLRHQRQPWPLQSCHHLLQLAEERNCHAVFLT